MREQGIQEEHSALTEQVAYLLGSAFASGQSSQLSYVSSDFMAYANCSTSPPVPELTPQGFDPSMFLVFRTHKGQVICKNLVTDSIPQDILSHWGLRASEHLWTSGVCESSIRFLKCCFH